MKEGAAKKQLWFSIENKVTNMIIVFVVSNVIRFSDAKTFSRLTWKIFFVLLAMAMLTNVISYRFHEEQYFDPFFKKMLFRSPVWALWGSNVYELGSIEYQSVSFISYHTMKSSQWQEEKTYLV